MKFVIQRVNEASVKVDGNIIGQINKGFLVLIGVGQDDTKEIADKMVKKLLGLRIFDDENDKINLSLTDVGGELLLISQFTLYANCKKGYRPSFIEAGAPDMANDMYEYIISQCRAAGFHVETGEFGADMKVSLQNDGPFTIVLDSREICQGINDMNFVRTITNMERCSNEPLEILCKKISEGLRKKLHDPTFIYVNIGKIENTHQLTMCIRKNEWMIENRR